MSPQQAALVNAMVPAFLGLALVIVGFFRKNSQPENKPAGEGTDAEQAPPPKWSDNKKRLFIVAGICMILLGFYNAWGLMNRPFSVP